MAPEYCPPFSFLGDSLVAEGHELKISSFCTTEKIIFNLNLFFSCFFVLNKAPTNANYICSHQRPDSWDIKTLKVSLLLDTSYRGHHAYPCLLFTTFPKDITAATIYLNVVTIWCCLYITELANNSSAIHFLNTNISTLFVSVCAISCCCQIVNILIVFLNLPLGTFISHYKETLRQEIKLQRSFIK